MNLMKSSTVDDSSQNNVTLIKCKQTLCYYYRLLSLLFHIYRWSYSYLLFFWLCLWLHFSSSDRESWGSSSSSVGRSVNSTRQEVTGEMETRFSGRYYKIIIINWRRSSSSSPVQRSSSYSHQNDESWSSFKSLAYNFYKHGLPRHCFHLLIL